MSARKPLNQEQRFVFGEDAFEPTVSVESPIETPNPSRSDITRSRQRGSVGKPQTPWGDLEPPEKEPTVRLNVDISLSLNDKLAAKARQLRKPKTELIRHLLEWVLDESNE